MHMNVAENKEIMNIEAEQAMDKIIQETKFNIQETKDKVQETDSLNRETEDINRQSRSRHTSLNIMTKSEGLKFYPGLVGKKTILVLRDSGSTAVLLRKSFVKQHEYTGRQVKVTEFDGTVKYLPTAIINITTPFYSGIVEALITAAQPVDLIIGNIQSVGECTEQDLDQCY